MHIGRRLLFLGLEALLPLTFTLLSLHLILLQFLVNAHQIESKQFVRLDIKAARIVLPIGRLRLQFLLIERLGVFNTAGCLRFLRGGALDNLFGRFLRYLERRRLMLLQASRLHRGITGLL